MPVSNLSLSVAKAAIEKAAKRAKVKPVNLTRSQFREYKDSTISEHALKSLGGFREVMNKLFASPTDDVEHPLETARICKADEETVAAEVAKLIEECAAEKGAYPHEIVFAEFQRWSKFAFGRNCKGIALYNITRAGGFNAIRDRFFPPKATPNTVQKLLTQEEARANRKAVREEALKKLVEAGIEERMLLLFEGKVKPIQPPRSSKKTKRILNILLSDLHFGSDLLAEKSRYNYGRLEEARRLAFIVKQVCLHKPEHREETELNVLLNGDIIENQLHDLRTGAVLSEQFMRAVHLLIQAIGHFSTSFKKVNVYCATGNHDRNKNRHKERASEDKFDSYATMIYSSVRLATINLPNVEWNIPLLPYTEFDLFGKKALITHSDNVIVAGNVSKSVNVGSIENQINKINSSLVDLEEYSVVALGHIHRGMHIPLDNGSTLITNPALVPPGPYSISLGCFESRTGQAMWESTEDYPVGDFRFIWVDRKTDQDQSLDSVINPWRGYAA